MAAQKFHDKTLLSALQKFTTHDALPTAPDPQLLHPFASGSHEPPTALLRDLVDVSATLSNSLNTYLGLAVNDAKSVSLLRQYGAYAHGLHIAEQETKQRIHALGRRVGFIYGEDIPLERHAMLDWCISRLDEWGRAAGMEIFKEEERNGRLTMVLGGKVLVIDVDFAIDRTSPAAPRIDVANVKTSHAIPSGTTTSNLGERSVSLDEFIKATLCEYLKEVQADDNVPDATRAARMAKAFQAHLAYLMKLDLLASQESDAGIRWFNDIGTLASTMTHAAKLEADAVASSLAATVTPLDIFLLRAHALPLPYITSPSVSFLTYLSPAAYLSLLRASAAVAPANDYPAKLDVSLPALRTLASYADLPGVTIATLTLTCVPHTVAHRSDHHAPSLSTRPAFALPTSTSLSGLDHAFPEPPPAVDGGAGHDVWILDFTDGGATKGIVMSQMRMREIQLLVNPFSAEEVLRAPLIYGSWIDLLLNPDKAPSERYTAVYTSPSEAHPPLHLRLMAPYEPGFLLGRVRVRTLKDVWAILEVVREQCWLNEALKTCHWTPEGTIATAKSTEEENGGPTDAEADLRAILSGTFKPRRIPVNVFIPYHTPTDPLYDEVNGLDTHATPTAPRLAMTVQTRASQLQITVGHDLLRPRGVRVDVGGSLPFTTAQVEKLEETARRGGILGLAGKVWSWSVAS